MVLTNFECWAHGESTTAANFETMPTRAASAVDMFNPRAVSQITSNGYYGYAYVNDANDNNNNNNADVDTVAMLSVQQCDDADVSVGAARCKKRCFVDGGSAVKDTFFDVGAAGEPLTAKRCRFDEGNDLAAQYFNDFFSLPVTQIGTTACLMDYDDMQQSAGIAEPTQRIVQQQPQEQQMEQMESVQQPHPRINHHYQGHLHRANRDNHTNKSNNKNCQMP